LNASPNEIDPAKSHIPPLCGGICDFAHPICFARHSSALDKQYKKMRIR
jgi:hypothetical protein